MIKRGLDNMQLLRCTLNGATPENAHIAARNVADTGRLIPWHPAFQSAFNKVTNEASVLVGLNW
jgi:hypothetical protein